MRRLTQSPGNLPWNELLADCQAHEIDRAMDVELSHEPRLVIVDGACGEIELLGTIFDCCALRDEQQHIKLALRERFQRRVAKCRGEPEAIGRRDDARGNFGAKRTLTRGGVANCP